MNAIVKGLERHKKGIMEHAEHLIGEHQSEWAEKEKELFKKARK